MIQFGAIVQRTEQIIINIKLAKNMNIKAKTFIEVCELYCENDSSIEGIKPESYHIKVAFDWRDVLLINECSEDLNYTIVICKDRRLTIKKDFHYCFSKFLSSRSSILSIN